MAAFALSGCVVLTGCVAVKPRPAPAAPLPPPGSGRPAQVGEPQIGQDPAREDLAPPAAEKTTPPAAGDAPRDRSRPGPAKPVTAEPPARPHEMPARPGRPVEPVTPAPVVVPPGVCALSEDYGHWRPGSTEARICREVYGN